MDIIVYHNPACRTSRDTLKLIRHFKLEPHVVSYLAIPPSRAMIVALAQRMNGPLRSLLRKNGTPFAELGLADESLPDDALLDAMTAHPILINRPIVVTPLGVRLCRPSEIVLDILPVMKST